MSTNGRTSGQNHSAIQGAIGHSSPQGANGLSVAWRPTGMSGGQRASRRDDSLGAPGIISTGSHETAPSTTLGAIGISYGSGRTGRNNASSVFRHGAAPGATGPSTP